MPKQPFTLEQLAAASPDQILIQAFVDAAEKLRRIIDREGDANGERLSTDYLNMLAIEAYTDMTQTRSQWAELQRKSSGTTINPTLLRKG